MSTKIYNAYKYNKPVSSLLEYLQTYRKLWREFHVQRLCSYLTDLSNDPNSPLYKQLFKDGKLDGSALENIIKKQSEAFAKSIFDPFDVSGSAVVYFYKKNVYVQLFLDCHMKAPPFKTDDMIDYHYQNQADPYFDYMNDEKKIPLKKMALMKRDWRQRKLVWNAIFDKTSYPEVAGLSYSMVSSFDYIMITYDVFGRLKEQKAKFV